MARSPFRRLDPRLAARLRPEKRTIAIGLACTLVAGLLDGLTIPLIKGAFSSIEAAAPRALSEKARAEERERAAGDRAADLATRLGVEREPVLRAIVESESAAARATESTLPRRIAATVGKPEAEVRTALEAARPRARGDVDAVGGLGIYSLLVVLLFGAKYFFTRGQTYYLSRAAATMSAALRRDLFRKLQRLPVAYFSRNRAGAVQSVLTNDVNVFSGAVAIVKDTLDAPVRGLIAFGFILAYQWQLAAVILLVLPAMVAVIGRNARKMREAQRTVQEDLADVSAFTTEALAGQRVVKAFAAESRIEGLYEGRVDRSLFSQLAAARRQAALKPLVELIGAVAIAIVIYLCGWLAYAGLANLGSILAVMYALDRVNQAFRSLGNVSNVFSGVQAATDRIHDLVLDVPEQVANAKEGLRPADPKGRIEFDRVTFRYPDGTEALTDVSFVLEPGTSLALVGPSGAGKSTVADLLLRFDDPTEGRILFDGVDLRELSLDWLRSRIGVVPQQTFLFAGSVADNVRMGHPDATDDDLAEAARLAHADEFVTALPERYDAEVGEGGNRLSGGQRQRLAIARALVRKPKVLLLDEATSALDAESERAVTEALDEVMRERTTLFIAHRLTTAARADRVLVLSKGRVVETGSHAELLAAGGAYAGLFRAFAGGVRD
mgnify:CR=1 FL=1